jgi:hypothetical protein
VTFTIGFVGGFVGEVYLSTMHDIRNTEIQRPFTRSALLQSKFYYSVAVQGKSFSIFLSFHFSS